MRTETSWLPAAVAASALLMVASFDTLHRSARAAYALQVERVDSGAHVVHARRISDLVKRGGAAGKVYRQVEVFGEHQHERGHG